MAQHEENYMLELQDAIYQAGVIAAKSEIQKRNADITKECVVVSDDEYEEGKYLVRLGTTPFVAYANDTTMHYLPNEVVYVQIPNGDMTQQKFILGRRLSEEDENAIYKYEFPFDDFVALKELIEPSPDEHGFLANKNKVYNNTSGQSDYQELYRKILTLDSSTSLTFDNMNLETVAGYEADNEVRIGIWNNSIDNPGPTIGDRLGITVNVQTLLDSQRPINGSFGLRIHITGKRKSTDANSKVTDYESDRYFRSKDMYGNPYAFTMPKEQQIIFDVSEYLRIERVEVFFYQDFLFFNQYNQYITWQRTNGLMDPNIIFSKLGVYLGFKASELGKDQVFLYTYDETIYGQNPDSLVDRNTLDRKTMYVAYVHYDTSTKQYTLYDSQEEFDAAGYSIYWYVKDNTWYLDAANTAYDEIRPEHKYGGLYWAPMSGEGNLLPVRINNKNEVIYSRSNYTFVPDIGRSAYRFRVAVRSEDTHTLSDILVFSNQKDVETDLQDLARNDKVIIRIGTPMTATDRASTIICQSSDFTNFFVYDENNNAIISDDKRTYTHGDVTYKFPDQKRYSDIPWYAEIWIKEDVFLDTPSETVDSVDGYVRLSDYCYAFDVDETTGLPVEKYVPFDVEWHTIQDPSMIEDFSTLGEEQLDYGYYSVRNNQQIHFDYSAYGEDHLETKFDVDKMTTRTFHIASTYDMNATHNTISATLRRNGQEFTVKCELMFGRASAQGCPYTPVIRINEPVGNTHIIANTPFELQCVIQDNYGKVYEGGFECEWSFIGNVPNVSITSYSPGDGIEGINSIVQGTLIDSGNCVPFTALCKVKKTSGDNAVPIDYEIYATRGMLVGSQNSATWMANHTVTSVSRVEFDSDGQAPHYPSQMFKVIGPPKAVTDAQLNILTRAANAMRDYIDTHEPTDETTMEQYVINIFGMTSNTAEADITTLETVVGVPLSDMRLADVRSILEKDYIYPTWELKAPLQLQDVIRLYDEPLYASVLKLVKQNDTYDPLKYYQLYNAEKNYYYAVNYANTYDTVDEQRTAFNIDKGSGLLFYREAQSYATFYNGSTANMPNVAQYYLKYGKNADAEGAEEDSSIDEDSTYWQWNDKYLTNQYFTYLTFKYHDSANNRDIIVSQAIAYFRYLYSSSLVDSWDGASLSLDTETSTIITKRLAAGTKNSRNQFSGVMMGAYDGYTSNQLMRSKTGIYGFQDGAMSFGLTDDGTGFIGPAGAGRIQFDGRNALISNSTQSCYINLNPSQITYGDVDAGAANWTDTSNAGLYPYFLYCKVPVDIYRTFSSSQKQYADQEMEWALPYLEDNSNSYFVVDPNRGTVISAGIATRYGRIGDWFINDTGLYQEYAPAKDIKRADYDTQEDYLTAYKDAQSKSRFMYLGMPAYNAITSDELRTQLGSVYGGYMVYKGQHQNDQGFSSLSEMEILQNYYKERRDNIINDTTESWVPATLEERVKTLGKYLNYSEFGVDVYHYYTFGTAARNVAAFLRRRIEMYYSYPVDMRTPELMHELIYGDQAKIDIVVQTDSDDWSDDGPLSERNLETYLHNHYTTASSSGTRVTYKNKTGANVYHTVDEGETYRSTALYGYLTNMSALLNGYSISTSGMTWWDPEITPNGNYAVDSNGNYPGEEYYVNYEDKYWNNAPDTGKAAYIRVTAIGEVAPRMRSHAAITYPVGSDVQTISYIRNSDASTVALPEADGVYINYVGSSFTLTNSGMRRGREGVDVDWLIGYCNALDTVYNYYHECFNTQLAQMLSSGLQILENKDPIAYAEASMLLDMMGGIDVIAQGGLDALDEEVSITEGLTTEAQLRAKYERKKAEEELKAERLANLAKEYNQVMDRINRCGDSNRYAIYAGYESPLTCYADEAPYPFFSVRWNGYMTARHGKIGYDSPWYISDAGLTQKNNSGIIFLGDPEQDGSDEKQTNDVGGHNGTKALFTDEFGNSLSCQMLPNGSTINGQVAYVQDSGATGEVQVPKAFATWSEAAVQDQNENYPYKGNAAYEAAGWTYLGPEAFGTYGNFAIYAGTDTDGINFGVRMDGTVFCKRLQAYEARIVGGNITGALNTNNSYRYGWPQPGVEGSNVSYTVSNEVTITNFTTQNGYNGLVDNEKLTAKIEAGGDIHVYQGGLQENFAADGKLQSLTITNVTGNTKVTVSDAGGVRYFFYDSTAARWKMTITGFTSFHIESTASSAEIANYIAGKDAILLGGTLSGWMLGSQSIYIKRSGVIGAGSNHQQSWVYSIHLDGANNQITLADSQIVLDGTNGVIYIGRPAFNNVNSALPSAFTTDSHLIMSNINITATTVGVTQYEATTIDGSSTIVMTTTQENGADGVTAGSSWKYTANGIVEVTTDDDPGTSVGSGLGENDLYDVSDGVVRGRSIIYKAISSTTAPNDEGSIVYDGGFYTICYAQAEPLAVPNASMLIGGGGGFGIAFSTRDLRIGVYPFENDSQLGFSSYNNDGTRYQDYRWNIGATAIVATKGIWIEDSAGNRDPVVCKAAFDYVIADINNSLDNLGAATGKNAKDTAYALSVAQNALNRANKALNKAIIDIKYSVSVFAEPGVNLFKITATQKDGTVLETEDWWAAGRTHRHDLSMSGGQLIIGGPNSNVVGDSQQTVFSGNDAISFSASADGKISFGITIADKFGTKDFNMADTAFYKAHAIKTVAIEAVSAGSASVHAHVTHLDDTTQDYSTQTLAVDVQNKKVTLGSTGAEIDCSGIYNYGHEMGYKAGFAKAVSNLTVSLTHPNNNSSGNVTATATISTAGVAYENITGDTKTDVKKINFSAGSAGSQGTGHTFSSYARYGMTRKTNDSNGNVPNTVPYIYYGGWGIDTSVTYYTGSSSGSTGSLTWASVT